MNTQKRIAFLVVSAMLALGVARTGWGGPPPNPTASDGYGNTAGGSGVLLNNSKYNNTGFGSSALRSNTTGNNNTATGMNALVANTTGSNNTAGGFLALRSNTTGDYNTANGFYALLTNTSGMGNTAYGSLALYQNTTGIYNLANGFQALYQNTTGIYNVGLGLYALGSNTTGNNNIGIGVSAGANVSNGNNNIFLGSNGVNGDNSVMRLGGTQTSTYIAGVKGSSINGLNALPVYIDSTGKLGTLSSSLRFKDDVRDMADTSRGLLQLRPVTFRYKQPTAEGNKPLEYGLIAEEVAKVYPDLVLYGANGKIETVQYHKLTPMLLNEVQRLTRAWQVEKNQNLMQAEQLRVQGEALKSGQTKIGVLESQVRLQNSQLQIQTQAIAELKQQIAVVQTQTRRMEILSARVSNRERNDRVGQIADASRP